MQSHQSDSAEKKSANVGISWYLAGLFIAADIAGAGLVSMPAAMVASDWIGATVMMILGAVISTYTGILLGNNWIMLQKRWPEYKSPCRTPYAEMAYRAIGPKFKHAVSLCLTLTQFGISVVYLLLVSNNIHHFLLGVINVNINVCFLIIVVGLFLLPVTMLRNLKDSRTAVVLALIASIGVVILIVAGSLADASTCQEVAHYPPVTSENFFLAFSTIIFAYAGHAIFPTIQQDMQNPEHFKRSVALGYTIVVLMLMPIAMFGYMIYGDSVRSSIIFSLQIDWLQQLTNALITLHVVLIMFMYFHPVNQQLEELLNLPQTFGWERVLVRTATIVVIVFVAESVPNFGAVLDLVGATTIVLMTMIFPCIVNLFLAAASAAEADRRDDDRLPIKGDYQASITEVFKYTPKWKLAADIIVMMFGLIGGALATWSALVQLVNSDFSIPCYVIPFLSMNNESEGADRAYTNCCGYYQNISRYDNFTTYCAESQLQRN